MTTPNTPRLCGGTFFILLLQARKPRCKARSTYGGTSDGLSETEMLKGLIRIIDTNYIDPPCSTFKNNTSTFKTCTISSGTYLPFDNATIIKNFDDKIKNNYTEILIYMSKFINTFIDIDNELKKLRLVKALLELIDKDTTIGTDELFYSSPDGNPLAKSQIHTSTTLCLDAFLLGIWHYIITSRKDNSVGQDTYKEWHSTPIIKGQRHKFISNIGDNIHSAIHITVFNEEKFNSQDRTTATSNDYSQPIDDRTIKDDHPKSPIIQQYINHQFVFKQSGNNNSQFAHADTVIIGKR